ncbi:MAG: hypothetical protein NT105_17075 [Verrucomicrobia bacterium]|nr:hypothetical protein [Verrucomicrobiota bacterium]
MKDNELRAIILQKHYDQRKAPLGEDVFLQPSDFDFPISHPEIFRICSQLAEHGLIKMQGDCTGYHCWGTITAYGIDVVESNGAGSTLQINFQHVEVRNSTHVQIGDQNVQTVEGSIQTIISALDASMASEAEKQHAKSLLKEFLKLPLVASIAGDCGSSIE